MTPKEEKIYTILDDHLGSVSAVSAIYYSQILRPYVEHLLPRLDAIASDGFPAEALRSQVMSYLRARIESSNKVSYRTLRRDLSVIKSFLGRLSSMRICPEVGTLSLGKLGVDVLADHGESVRKTSEYGVAQEYEVELMMSYAKEHCYRDYVAMVWMYHYGLRGAEVCSLVRKQIVELSDGSGMLQRMGKSQRKSGTPSEIPIPQRIVEITRMLMGDAWNDPEAHVFTALYPHSAPVCYGTGEPMTPKVFAQRFSMWAEKSIGRKMGTHAFRRGRATTLLALGESREDIGKYLSMTPATIKAYDKRSLKDYSTNFTRTVV